MMLVELRRITVDEYHRMGELGILNPDERVELIDGQIFNKPMKGTPHSAAVGRTDNLLRNRLSGRVLVRLQDPVRLNDYSEPEPDIAVVVPNPSFYEDHHPTLEEIYLIIEVADSSLNRDTEFQAVVYGRSGISDYWVLDVTNRQLHVFREPSLEGYRQIMVLSDEDSISPLAFPEIVLAVGDMLRSQ
ncbi:MAG: Uma2 family endonuclease [Cyanobacteria bacterium J055]|nr:MAG: Uma2 family endonuclease [Cyanobacteria bacterium J055]